MSIIISNPSPSVSGPVTPLFKQFTASKDSISNQAVVGGSSPANTEISLTFKNYADLPEYDKFSGFTLTYETAGDDFFKVIGIEESQSIPTAPVDIEISYYNFAQLSKGSYSGSVIFSVYGQNSDTNRYELIETITVNTNLNAEDSLLSISPETILISHVKNEAPAWAGSVNVSFAGEWSLLNSAMENSQLLKINDSIEQFQYFIGDQTLALSLSPDVNELPIGLHQLKVYFYCPTLTAELTIKLLIKESEPVTVSPGALQFFAVKNVLEAPEQEIVLIAPGEFESISIPYWCTTTTEYYEGGFTLIRIKPIHSINFSPGIYEADFTAVYQGVPHTVAITHRVVGEWDFSYDKNVHFTKDNDILEFYSQSPEDSYLKVTGAIVVRDFDHNERLISRDWALKFMNGKAEFNLGREIDSYLKLLNNPGDQIKSTGSIVRGAYLPTSVKLSVREIKFEDETTVNMFSIPFQYYLRGRKPRLRSDIPFFLTHHEADVSRITKNSQIMINVYKPDGQFPGLSLKRNGIGIQDFNVSNVYNQPSYYSCLFRVSSLQDIEAGETLSFAYGGRTRKFIMLPEQPYSFHIGWINQFEMLDIFEFTGAAKFDSDLTFSNSKVFTDWVEVTRKVEESIEQSLTINTGWIFKNDSKKITELLRSKRAFLIKTIGNLSFSDNISIPPENFIELVPVSKKKTDSDTELELYEYDVEFIINRKYEDSVYM